MHVDAQLAKLISAIQPGQASAHDGNRLAWPSRLFCRCIAGRKNGRRNERGAGLERLPPVDSPFHKFADRLIGRLEDFGFNGIISVELEDYRYHETWALQADGLARSRRHLTQWVR